MKPETDIYTDLHRRLVSGQLAPGQKLRAETLRKDYDCSASTVREALFRLSTIGLVDFQEQRGFRATEFSQQLQHELTHLRILLEGEGASMSIRNGGRPRVAMRSGVENSSMAKASSSRFHRATTSASTSSGSTRRRPRSSGTSPTRRSSG